MKNRTFPVLIVSVIILSLFVNANPSPEPQLTDLNGDGVADIFDLVIQQTNPAIPTGDANGDYAVDILDLVTVASSFGTMDGDAAYNPSADLNKDSEVDVLDLSTVGINTKEYGAMETASVYIEPASTMVGPSTNFTVNVSISSTDPVYGAQAEALFDNTLVEALEMKEGSFLSQGGVGTFFWPVINNTIGKVTFMISRTGQVDGVSGTGSLASIVFRSKATLGTSLLDLFNVKVSDKNAQEISSAATDGSVTVFVNQPPVAEAGGSYTGSEGSPVSFSGSGSYDPDGFIVSYEWDLDNDGQYDDATGASPSRTWNDEYSGTIGLKVTDNSSAVAYDTASVTVNNVAPTVDAGGPYSGNEGSLITFTAAGYDPGSDTLEYRWDWENDGTYDTGWSASASAPHTWNDEYTGTVKVQVMDNDGGFGIDTASVTVNNVAPIAEAGPDQSGNEGSVFYFSGSATDPGSDTLTYSWNFGDGGTGSGQTPSHVYADNGVYTVTLTVTDGDGGSDTDTLTATISNVAPSITSYSPTSNTTISEGGSQTFSVAYSDPGSDTLTLKWYVNGVYKQTGGNYIFNTDYSSAGIYNVKAEVSDDDGGKTTREWTLTVSNVPMPDLVVSYYYVRLGINPGSAAIEFKMKNVGDAAANNFYWDISAPSSTIDPVGKTARSLAPGEETEAIGAGVHYSSSGTYGATIIADYTNAVAESNEGNNNQAVTVTI